MYDLFLYHPWLTMGGLIFSWAVAWVVCLNFYDHQHERAGHVSYVISCMLGLATCAFVYRAGDGGYLPNGEVFEILAVLGGTAFLLLLLGLALYLTRDRTNETA